MSIYCVTFVQPDGTRGVKPVFAEDKAAAQRFVEQCGYVFESAILQRSM